MEKHVPAFADENTVLAWGKAIEVDENGLHLAVNPADSEQYLHMRRSEIVRRLLFGCYIPSVTVICRRSALELIGGFKQPHNLHCVDYPTWLALAPLGDLKFVDSVLGYWVRHGSSLSTQFSKSTAWCNCSIDAHEGMPYELKKQIGLTHPQLIRLLQERLDSNIDLDFERKYSRAELMYLFEQHLARSTIHGVSPEVPLETRRLNVLQTAARKLIGRVAKKLLHDHDWKGAMTSFEVVLACVSLRRGFLLHTIRNEDLRVFCERFARFALRKLGGLPGSEILETAIMVAKLKAGERGCVEFPDYLRLIGHTCGLFGIKSLAAAQKETEIVSLLAIVSKLPLESAVEIGTGNGGTFYMLCKAAESNAVLLTIDLDNDWKRTALLRSCAKHGQRIHVIRGNSQDRKIIEKVIRTFGSRGLDLLFIDGDHSFAGVTKDFELYSKLIRPGGIIAIHDILPDYRTRYGIERHGYTGDVPKFWNAIKSRWRSRELVDSYDQDGQGIGVIEWDPSSLEREQGTP